MTVTIDQNMFVAGGLLLLLAWLLSHRCPDCPLAAARPVAGTRDAAGEHAAEGRDKPSIALAKSALAHEGSGT